jgi:hypothetical protein
MKARLFSVFIVYFGFLSASGINCVRSWFNLSDRDFSSIAETSTKTYHIDFDDIMIESPSGQKEYILALASNTGTEQQILEKWYGQFVTAAENLKECALFVGAKFNPVAFTILLKQKGYKVYWRKK